MLCVDLSHARKVMKNEVEQLELTDKLEAHIVVQEHR